MTREEAMEILTHNWTRVDNPNYSESELDKAFFMAIEALSAEIVLCKDCKHHHYSVDNIPYCDWQDYGYGWKDDDFCSWGERKGGEDE